MTEQKLLLTIGELEESYIEELQVYISRRSGKRRRPRVLVLAAIVGALLLALTAGAVEIALGEGENWFKDFFSREETIPPGAITEHQLDLLDRGLVELGQRVSCDGYTVSLASALCDGHRLLAKITVEAPEGITLEGDRYGLVLEFDPIFPDGEELPFRVMQGGCSQLEDGDSGDGILTFLLDVTLQPKPGEDSALIQGMGWEIRITELLRDHGKLEEYYVETIASGEWSFAISFDSGTLLTREDELLESPVWISGKRVLRSKNFPVTVRMTSLRLRALSMTWCYDEPLTGYWEGIKMDDVYVVLKDGTRILAHYDMGSNMSGYWQDTFLFPVPVAPEDINYVELPGGKKIALQ